MPLISVIVPVFNAEKYLGRCVGSILNQTCGDFELILVNDGSLDNSGRICDDFALADSRVRVIHKENSGVSEARNTGIENAKGEYVTFVDCDDYVSENLLSVLTEKICGADLAVASLKMVFESYEEDYCMGEQDFTLAQLMSGFCEEKFPHICMCGPCCKLYKREIIIEQGVSFDKKMKLGEDTVFNMFYLKHCKKISATDKICYFYMRDNQQSLYSKFRDNWYNDSESAYNSVMALAQSVGVAKNSLNKYTKVYLSNLMANLIIAVRTASKERCFEYMKKMYGDCLLKEKAYMLKDNRIMFLTLKAIQHKLFGVVYFLLSKKYRK